MEKNLLKDILESLWEPIRNIEFIKKEYGLKEVKIYSGSNGYLNIELDDDEVYRCLGKWSLVEKLPFSMG